jgi:hypothetical protein
VPVLLTHRVQASASCQRPPSLSARVQPGAVCGPQAPDHPQRSATGGAAGDARGRGDETRGLATEAVRLRSHRADGVGRDGAAGRQKAAVTDLSKASGHDRREASAEQLQGVESGRAWACTTALTGGDGDGAVLERDDAAVGDGALKTSGARSWTDVWPSGLAWRWTFPSVFQASGSLGPSSPAWAISSLQSAREMGERACTGTEQWARDGRHGVRFSARPLPGPMEWMGGWSGSGLPQGGRRPGQPGRRVPLQRSAGASRARACAEAVNSAWEARRCCERSTGRRVSGTVQVTRQCGPGRCCSRWCGNHCGGVCGGHCGQWRGPQA